MPRHQNDESDYDEPPNYVEHSLLYESDSDAHEFSDDEDYPQFAATGDGHAYNQHHYPSTATLGPFSSEIPTHDLGVGPITNLHPAEQYLASLVVQRNLPKDMYKEIWDWWFFTHYTKYPPDRKELTFDTVMRRMQQCYGGMAGGAAIAKSVDVPGSLPVNVYHFYFFKVWRSFLTMTTS